MGSTLSLSIIEILVLMVGAITLGITIHFFIVSRRALNATSPIQKVKINKELEERKLRYLNDLEWRDKEIADLKKRIADEKESGDLLSIESDELRSKNKKLQSELESIRSGQVIVDKPGYVDQLRQAQTNLREYNEKINRLLEQIDIVKDSEEKQREIEKSNEELSTEVSELRSRLSQKEKEMSVIQQKQELSTEMTSLLDSAYSEFSVLQNKMQKLEQQVVLSRRNSLDYEDIKEENQKLTHDLNEIRNRYQTMASEKNELDANFAEAEDKLKEANYQRQQLQKKVTYLEELNLDLQTMAEANKKLESQIKRIGELESMLHIAEEERDELARRKYNSE